MKDYSNYHNINTNDKMTHDGLLLLENSLNGFEGFDALISNSISTKVLIYQKYDVSSTTKKVIGKSADIEIGNLLTINNENWLVTTYPESNKVYKKAEMQLCNFELQVKTGETKTLLGYDDFKRPVYNVQTTSVPIPSIVKNNFWETSLNEQVNLPSEKMLITITYNDTSKLIKENDTYDMYGREYKVVGIDFSNVYSNKGIITLTTERVTNT